MQYGNVQGIEKKISRIVQGSIMLNRSNKEEGFALLDAARQAGITTYDSAHGYGGGEVDRMLGLWMEERGNRDEIVIIGKGAHLNQDRNRVTPYDIASDMADSLVRLRSDYIDLYSVAPRRSGGPGWAYRRGAQRTSRGWSHPRFWRFELDAGALGRG